MDIRVDVPSGAQDGQIVDAAGNSVGTFNVPTGGHVWLRSPGDIGGQLVKQVDNDVIKSFEFRGAESDGSVHVEADTTRMKADL